MPGFDGINKMRELMAGLRKNPPTEIAGCAIVARRDYETGTEVDMASGAQRQMELSGSNVLRFDAADGTIAIVRPSGTEPKVKVYIMANGKTHTESRKKLDRFSKWAEGLA